MTELDPSTEDLLFAVDEVCALPWQKVQAHALNQRLHVLLLEARNPVRAFLEDRVVPRLRGRPGSDSSASTSSSGTVDGASDSAAPVLPSEPVTAAMLAQAGLTLARLLEKDSKALHARALIHAGVLRSYADAALLGAASMADFVRVVGAPRHVSKWVGAETVWRTDWLPALRFNFRSWLAARALLHPADLSALEFNLGAHITADAAAWSAAAFDAASWLTTGSRQEWTDTYKQLSNAQYEALAGLAQPTRQAAVFDAVSLIKK
jgi:hypothetical protein